MITNNGIICFGSSLVVNNALTANEVFLTLPQNCRPKNAIELSVYCTGFNGSAGRVVRINPTGEMYFLSSAVVGTGTIWLNGVMFSINDNYM